MTSNSEIDALIDTYTYRDKRSSVEGRDFVTLLEEFNRLKLAFYELERLHFRQLKAYEMDVK